MPTNPIAFQINGHKTGRNGEKVDEWVSVEQEPHFVGSGDEANEEINQKKYVKS